MNTLETLLQQIKSTPENTEFQQVISIITEHYDYTPSQFSNGRDNDCVISQAGENEGSCKIFAFAQLNQLNKNQTLHCFGNYYRNDVLEHPENIDHANIRTFTKHGSENITFETMPLIEK